MTVGEGDGVCAAVGVGLAVAVSTVLDGALLAVDSVSKASKEQPLKISTRAKIKEKSFACFFIFRKPPW